MFLNYLKVAFRNLLRRFSYSAINILGLGVGLACTLIIGLWVYQEYSYDRHFENADRIYRVGVNFYNIGEMAPGPARFTPEMRENFPQVERATWIDALGVLPITVDRQEYREQGVFEADSAFFEVFSYPFLEGDPSTALNTPNSVVLVESLAGKYFGNPAAAVGREILVGDEQELYTVTGVVEERDVKSHIPARMWLSAELAEGGNWTSASPYNYVLLREGTGITEYAEALDRMVEREVYNPRGLSQPYDEWKRGSTGYYFVPINIRDIYLKSDFRFDLMPMGNLNNVQVFAAVALFILLIAAINFINIVTARGATRAREVGIRKTLGTGRPALIMQFLLESVLLSVISMILALGLAELFLALFKSMTGLVLMESVINAPGQLGSMALIALTVGVLAGLYPAFYLTRFDPVSVLKGTYKSASSSAFRNGLVVSQFAISICLIICAGLVYRQLNFMQQKDLGFTKENVLVIQNTRLAGESREAFKQEVASLSGVQSVSYSGRLPAGSSVSIWNLRSEQMEHDASLQHFMGDEDYLSTLGFRLLEGRNFSSELASDTSAIILNQSAVRELGLSSDPIGARLNGDLEVIGVVSDFNFESLRNDIEPVALSYWSSGGPLAVKLREGSAASVLESLRQMWGRYTAEEEMNYYFLDQNFEQLLENEKTLSKVVAFFTVLAIFISCLGLFGLSSYVTEQRTREIGIRRILGADITRLVVQLNLNFTMPVAIAILIALPAAYLIMDRWLGNFAYKAGMSPWIFAGAAAGGLLIAWLTVSWQSLRAARTNPVDSLRTE